MQRPASVSHAKCNTCIFCNLILSLSRSLALIFSLFQLWGAGKEKSGLDLIEKPDKSLDLGFMSILVSIPESERGISLWPA